MPVVVEQREEDEIKKIANKNISRLEGLKKSKYRVAMFRNDARTETTRAKGRSHTKNILSESRLPRTPTAGLDGGRTAGECFG